MRQNNGWGRITLRMGYPIAAMISMDSKGVDELIRLLKAAKGDDSDD